MLPSLLPLMICDKSPTGRLKGKSTLASSRAAKIHHPATQVTNAHAPPALVSLRPVAIAPFASCQKAPVRQAKARVRVRKIITKATLVRREQMR